ncbi:FMN-binding negative transcriptional regulator [Undibacterium arcticum]
MYVPPHFREDDPALLMEVMQRHSFATLVSNLDGAPFASHLPLKVSQDDAGVRIDGHFARANPHWQALQADPNALVIFFRDRIPISRPPCTRAAIGYRPGTTSPCTRPDGSASIIRPTRN